jgi:hypothetical protein
VKRWRRLSRFAGFALIAAVAWYVSAVSGGVVAAAATLLVLVAGFTLAFGDSSVYLGAASLCAAIIVIDGLATHQRISTFFDGLLTGLGVFLAIAVPTLVIAAALLQLAEIKYVAFMEDRYALAPFEGTNFWISVMSSAYGVPIGVACGLIVGAAFGGWIGVILALLVGSGIGALAAQIGGGAAIWWVGKLTGPVQTIHREEFLDQARQVPGALLSATVATVALESGAVREFAVTQALELMVLLLVTGGLAVMLPQIMGFMLSFGPNAFAGLVKFVLIGLGPLIGVGLGWFASAMLLKGITTPTVKSLALVGAAAIAAAIIALVIGRLGMAVGLTIGAILGALAGQGLACGVLCDWSIVSRTLALAGLGSVTGGIVFAVFNIVSGIHGSQKGAFVPTAAVLTFGGMLAAVVVGAIRGIGAM